MGYESDFRVFLKHTNEKEVLGKEIIRLIKKFKIQSILDIGAGNGDLSYPLSQEVKEYLCVESKKDFAKLLRKRGLKVVEREFPTKIDKTFDMVLCSHSIPNRPDELKIFLNVAWKNVKPGGILLIITYVGDDKDEWVRFLKLVRPELFVVDYMKYEKKLQMLRKFGKPDVKNIFSEVATKNKKDMISALSFVAGGGIKKEKDLFLRKKPIIDGIINEKYHRKGEYFFPFRHIFITIRK